MQDTIIEQVGSLAALDAALWVGPATSLVRIIVIAICAWVAIRVLQRIISSFRLRLEARMTDANTRQRAETLGRVFRYIVTVLIGGIALMLILAEFGVSMAPLLGASGVIGLAIGFGSQSLVKDFFSGFFILFEDQIRRGDIVKVGEFAGLVEDVTLRHVRLRDYDGHVHFVPNNLITTVTNMSRLYAWAVIDVGVSYREDIDECLDVMRETGASLRSDPPFTPKILEALEIAGVERWDESAIVLRCRFRVAPLEQWNVRREYLRRLKQAFDQRGIEIPYPHVTVYAGQSKDRTAPAFSLAVMKDVPDDVPGQPNAA